MKSRAREPQNFYAILAGRTTGVADDSSAESVRAEIVRMSGNITAPTGPICDD